MTVGVSHERDSDGGILDIDTLQWTSIKVSSMAPQGGIRTSAILTNNKMIVWGGKDPKNVGAILNLDSMVWTKFPDFQNAPAVRQDPASVMIDNKMVIWGGTSENKPRNDGAVFEIGRDL